MLSARDAGTTPDQLLVDQGVITAEQRAQAIAERLGLDYLDLTQYRLDMAAVNLLPPDVARRCELVPVARIGESTLVVAMADPANVVAIDDVEIQMDPEAPLQIGGDVFGERAKVRVQMTEPITIAGTISGDISSCRVASRPRNWKRARAKLAGVLTTRPKTVASSATLRLVQNPLTNWCCASIAEYQRSE